MKKSFEAIIFGASLFASTLVSAQSSVPLWEGAQAKRFVDNIGAQWKIFADNNALEDKSFSKAGLKCAPGAYSEMVCEFADLTCEDLNNDGTSECKLKNHDQVDGSFSYTNILEAFIGNELVVTLTGAYMRDMYVLLSANTQGLKTLSACENNAVIVNPDEDIHSNKDFLAVCDEPNENWATWGVAEPKCTLRFNLRGKYGEFTDKSSDIACGVVAQ
ncbi:MAG: hypothetical protein KBD78_02300 [Oligoflexales bacterium]|nr:hypothetical protein [Oligoflexales bacterium]